MSPSTKPTEDDGKTFSKKDLQPYHLPSRAEFTSKYPDRNYDAFIKDETEQAKERNQKVVIAAEPVTLKPAEKPSEMRFPMQPKALKGMPDAARLSNWAAQYKSELLTKCNAKGGGKSCYFPLTPVRDPRRDNQPRVVTGEDGRDGWVGVCSYDPTGHGEQVIYPPKKDDEL